MAMGDGTRAFKWIYSNWNWVAVLLFMFYRQIAIVPSASTTQIIFTAFESCYTPSPSDWTRFSVRGSRNEIKWKIKVNKVEIISKRLHSLFPHSIRLRRHQFRIFFLCWNTFSQFLCRHSFAVHFSFFFDFNFRSAVALCRRLTARQIEFSLCQCPSHTKESSSIKQIRRIRTVCIICATTKTKTMTWKRSWRKEVERNARNKTNIKSGSSSHTQCKWRKSMVLL